MTTATTLHRSLLRTPLAWQTAAVVGFAALTAVGAQLVVPTEPVPFTLQTLVTLLAAAFLGRGRGAFSQALYLIGGLALPAFAGGTFGLAVLTGATGGYLLALPLAALVVGHLLGGSGSRGLVSTVVSLLAGVVIILGLGCLWLKLALHLPWSVAFAQGVAPFIGWELVKVAAVTALVQPFRAARAA